MWNPSVAATVLKKWTPRALPGTTLWLDPSDRATLAQVSTRSTEVHDGDPVGFAQDKSSFGADLIQATAGDRPLWRAGGGFPYLDFVSSDFLSRAVAQPVQTAIIGLYYGSTSPSQTGVLANTSDTVSNIDFIFSTNGSPVWDTAATAGGGMAVSTRFWNNRVQTANVTTDTVRVYSCDALGGTPGSTGNGLVLGGDRGLAGRFLVGRVYGVILTRAVLDPDQRRLAEYWMAAKCGIQLNG